MFIFQMTIINSILHKYSTSLGIFLAFHPNDEGEKKSYDFCITFGLSVEILNRIYFRDYTEVQKFRIDYEGCRDLRLSEESKFTFKIKRLADLLMDTYVVINLPNI